MNLKTFISTIPIGQKNRFRRLLAEAHGVTFQAVRHWEDGRRTHPHTLEKVKITERLTNGAVTRYDLHPDIFGSNQKPAASVPVTVTCHEVAA